MKEIAEIADTTFNHCQISMLYHNLCELRYYYRKSEVERAEKRPLCGKIRVGAQHHLKIALNLIIDGNRKGRIRFRFKAPPGFFNEQRLWACLSQWTNEKLIAPPIPSEPV